MDVEGAAGSLPVGVEDAIHQGLPRDGRADALGESGQKIELDPGELHALAGVFHHARAEIDAEGARLDHIARVQKRAAQPRLDAGEEFLGPEGLGHVVVGAEGEGADLRGRLVAGGENEDRGLRGLAIDLEDVEAVRAGEHEVEHHQVVLLRVGVEGGVAVLDPGHLEAVALQVGDDLVPEVLVVFDEEDSRAHGGWRGQCRLRTLSLPEGPLH